MDGTLLDTSQDIQLVLNQSLKKFGLPQISLESLKNYLGNGAKTLVRRAVGGNDGFFDEIYADYIQNFSNCDNALTKLYAGEAEALNNFKASGIKLAIISNKPQIATERVVKQHLCNFGFDAVIGQKEIIPLKPDPSSTLELIKEIGVEKEEVLFVGDGETDVLTAVNAGIRCVSVLWGYRSRVQLEAAGAKVFANDFTELENLVKNL